MADLAQIAASTRNSIGRYFSLVSAVPSAVLVGWTTLLVQSGAWSGQPDIQAALLSFTKLGIAGTAGLILASLAVALILHPMQFAFVQFLEGYWGSSRLAARLRYLRIKAAIVDRGRRLDRLAQLDDQIADLEEDRRNAPTGEYDRITMCIVELASLRSELDRVSEMEPTSPEAMMPTRLGNVLRRFEWGVGAAYGLDAVTAVPFLSRVAQPGDMGYVNDQRSQLDLAVRMTVVSLCATILSTMFLARHGLWLLLGLIPYAGAYLSYRGAVVAAAAYGRALGVLVTLNRFSLYERLRLPPVRSLAGERAQNAVVAPLLRHGSGARTSLTYRGGPLPPPPPASPPSVATQTPPA